jgi:hypothetical protein
MAPEPISMAYFIIFFHQSVCLHVYPQLSLLSNRSVKTFPRQRIHKTVEELLEASFPMRSVSFQMNVGDKFFPELLVII